MLTQNNAIQFTVGLFAAACFSPAVDNAPPGWDDESDTSTSNDAEGDSETETGSDADGDSDGNTDSDAHWRGGHRRGPPRVRSHE